MLIGKKWNNTVCRELNCSSNGINSIVYFLKSMDLLLMKHPMSLIFKKCNRYWLDFYGKNILKIHLYFFLHMTRKLSINYFTRMLY
jgi:hypothetical protein